MKGRGNTMLSQVSVTRIRSILSANKVSLAPVTLLVGENGTGKSNLLKAISLSSRLSRGLLEYDELDLLPDGYHTQNCWKGQYIGIPYGMDEVYAYSSSPETSVRLDFHHSEVEDDWNNVYGSIRFNTNPALELPYNEYRISSNNPPALLETAANIKYLPTNRLEWHTRSFNRMYKSNQYNLSDSFLDIEDYGLLSGDGLVSALEQIRKSSWASRRLIDLGEELFHLGWDLLTDNSYDLHQIATNPGSIPTVERAIGREEDDVVVPIMFGSLGMRQLFPFIVHSLALASRKDGGILLVEEPEISLHPSAQVRVGEYLAELGEMGVQIIMTTHSHYLVQGVCKQVRDRKISISGVSILNFTKGHYGTKINHLAIDNYGRIDGWIPSFAMVDDYLFNDWMNSIGDSSE